jgi:hypothetical protein
MTLEWQLVKDNRIIFRFTVGPSDEYDEGVSSKMNKREIERLANIYSIAGNEKRLRIMLEFTRRGQMRFTDVLQVALNPKLVGDCMEPFVKGGLVSHEGRGSFYKPSEFGNIVVSTMTTVLPRILAALEAELEEDELE